MDRPVCRISRHQPGEEEAKSFPKPGRGRLGALDRETCVV